jgi:excisionase family DNA binding protein
MVLARARRVTSSNQSADGTDAPGRSLDVSVPIFFTAQQVADMLQVDERTVLRWAQHDASMPATRLGRVVRFEREPLLRWLARKQPRAARGLAHASLSRPPGAA